MLPSPSDWHVTPETACLVQPKDPNSYYTSREPVPSNSPKT
jgi:hypothetical protein